MQEPNAIEPKPKSLGFVWRAITTIVAVVGYFLTVYIYNLGQSPLSGAVTAKTLNDSPTDFMVAKAVHEGAIPSFAFWTLIVVLAIVWIPFLWKALGSLPDFGPDIDEN